MSEKISLDSSAFRCLNKWYMRFVVINQNEKDYN